MRRERKEQARNESMRRLVARFGWAAGLVDDPVIAQSEKLRRYRRALERIAQGGPDAARIAARALAD